MFRLPKFVSPVPCQSVTLVVKTFTYVGGLLVIWPPESEGYTGTSRLGSE